MDSRPYILYGLGKIHNETNNGLSPFRSVLQFLAPLTANQYIDVDSFYFAEKICQQDPDLYMANQHVAFLFPNILLDETIDIYTGNFYSVNENSLKSLSMVFVICLKAH